MEDRESTAAVANEAAPDPGAQPPAGGRGRAGGVRSFWNPVELTERYGILALWAIIIVFFSLLRPHTFPTSSNFETIFGTQAVQLVITLGLIVSLTAGEFDLSVASVMGFAATMVAWLNVNHHWALIPAIIATLVAGLIIGGFNAFVIVRIGVSSLIVTLGVGTFLSGLGFGISNSVTIGGISQNLITAMQTTFLGLPIAFYIGLLICILLWYALGYTPFGRHLLFVGEGRDVARLAGLRVDSMRALALITTTMICTIAGIMQAGVVGAADPGGGPPYLLPAFAGAFLGQTVINPGRYSAWGVFVATYFLVTGITGLQLLGAQGWVQDVFYGGALVIAVTLARLAARRRQA
ncbi:MAG TPA: ABC transporter permease [Solirubrobacteraceae bacterium]|nr:ABC transporter permease [Solirubrobacteraceae bacterium]